MNQQIYEEAAEWMIEFRSSPPDATARTRFDEWLSRSPEHVRAYLECTAISEAIEAGPRVAPGDIDSLIERARRSSEQNVIPLPAPSEAAAPVRKQDDSATASGFMSRGIRLAIAAIVVFAAVGVSLQYLMSRNMYETAIGEQRSILLQDGSTIDLNARSKVRVRLSGRTRSVDLLEGEALFRVAKDETRPFVVFANGTRVRAVGTEFAINHRQRGLLVTVVEGTVAVWGPSIPASSAADEGDTDARPAPSSGAAADEIVLNAGQQLALTASANGGSAQVRFVDVQDAIAWTQRRLVFDSTPLRDVVAEFNRHSSRALVIQGGGLEDFHISGAFSSTDVQPFIRFLQAQPGVEVIEEPDRIIIVHR